MASTPVIWVTAPLPSCGELRDVTPESHNHLLERLSGSSEGSAKVRSISKIDQNPASLVGINCQPDGADVEREFCF